MSEVVASNLPIWVIMAILGVQAGIKLRAWKQNGTTKESPTPMEWGAHCRIMEGMFEADPPRKHTELLTELVGHQKEVLREIRGFREDLKNGEVRVRT